MPKCKKCNISLIEDDSRSSVDENVGMTATFHKIGHCPNCDAQYHWTICYDLENPLLLQMDEI